MTDQPPSELIVAGEFDEAVNLALERRVGWVAKQLEDEAATNVAAEHVATFVSKWLPALPALERLQAVKSIADLPKRVPVPLEQVNPTNIRLLLEAQQAAASELAGSFRDFWALTDSPDAEIDASVADRLARYAERLDSMNFGTRGAHL